MRLARIYRWTRMRRYVERSSDAGPLLQRLFCLGCIIAMLGYDFWEGHPAIPPLLGAFCRESVRPAAQVKTATVGPSGAHSGQAGRNSKRSYFGSEVERRGAESLRLACASRSVGVYVALLPQIAYRGPPPTVAIFCRVLQLVGNPSWSVRNSAACRRVRRRSSMSKIPRKSEIGVQGKEIEGTS